MTSQRMTFNAELLASLYLDLGRCHTLAATMPTKRGGIPTCYATCSMGHKPEHTLPAKLKAISDVRFKAIKLSMPDLLSFAKEKLESEVGPKDFDDLCRVGPEVKKLCQENGLRILVLQPFANFEGWKKDPAEARDAFQRAEGWMRTMESVGTDMLQVSDANTTLERLGSCFRVLARLTERNLGRVV